MDSNEKCEECSQTITVLDAFEYILTMFTFASDRFINRLWFPGCIINVMVVLCCPIG